MRPPRRSPGSAGHRRLHTLDLCALAVLLLLTGLLALLGRANERRIRAVEVRGVAAAVYTDLGTYLERQHTLFVEFGVEPTRGRRDAFIAELTATEEIGRRHTAQPFRDMALAEASSVAGPYRDFALAAIGAMDARLESAPGAAGLAREVGERYRSLRAVLLERRIARENDATDALVSLERSGSLVSLWAPPLAAIAAAVLVAIGARTRRSTRRLAGLEAMQSVSEEREAILRSALAEQEEAARAAREASRVKDRLVATVSHEFRSPLTSIIGYADILRRRGAGLTPERQAEFLDLVKRQGERLAGMIENLLTLAGLKQRTVFAPHDRSTDASAAVATLAREFEMRGTHRFALSAEPNLSAAIERRSLEHILTNLLDNACKYSPEGTLVRVHAERNREGVAVSVADEGPGIPPGEAEAVFDAFWRAPGRTEPGSGLGLAIVRGLAEACGGRVAVAPTPGGGACFTVVIPALPSDAVEAAGRVSA